MGTLAFPHLSSHCNVDDCKLIDFLPFNCDRCNQVFCLQHKSYTKHLCPPVNQIDAIVLVCPLCAQRVRLHRHEDPNVAWEIHVNCECDPSNYQNAAKRKLCPVAGCGEALVFANTIRCTDCALEHCLRHRFAPDHGCAGPKGFMNALRRSLKRELTPAKCGVSLRNSARSLRDSVEAGVRRLSAAANQALQKAKYGMALGSGDGEEAMEQCLQCRARFLNVGALIDHAEKVHDDGGARTAGAIVAVDVCPLCGKTFGDPVLLVAHVEKNHGTSAS